MKVQARASLSMAATAAEIFAVLIDPAHHKNILPPAFLNYKSENEDNTVVTFQLKSGLINRNYRVQVEVIEPNRLIHETEIATGIITKFILEPIENSSFTMVTFDTTWDAKPGIPGFIERTLGRKFLENLYAEEQQNLARYMAQLKHKATV